MQVSQYCGLFLSMSRYIGKNEGLNCRSSCPEVFLKLFLEISQNSREYTVCIFIKKETLAQVFSCEFCEISKNNFFIEHSWWLLLTLNLSLQVKPINLKYYLAISTANSMYIKVILSKYLTTCAWLKQQYYNFMI